MNVLEKKDESMERIIHLCLSTSNQMDAAAHSSWGKNEEDQEIIWWTKLKVPAYFNSNENYQFLKDTQQIRQLARQQPCCISSEKCFLVELRMWSRCMESLTLAMIVIVLEASVATPQTPADATWPRLTFASCHLDVW